MDNLVSETNSRLQDIIENLTIIKTEYENKLKQTAVEIQKELKQVNKYKEEFFVAKKKVEKMNSDIEGFEQDYQNLVDRFKDDELANILIAANKEISSKIAERRRKIARDKIAMNSLIEKAELSKEKLVKITAEKKALELCLVKILDAYEFYSKALTQVIEYTNNNIDDLSKCFYDKGDEAKKNIAKAIEEISFSSKDIVDNILADEDLEVEDDDSIDSEVDEIIDEEFVAEEISEDEDLIDEEEVDEEIEEKEKIDISEDETEENMSDDMEENVEIEEIFDFDDSLES